MLFLIPIVLVLMIGLLSLSYHLKTSTKMIQEIIVYTIGIAVVVLILSKIYRFLFGKKEDRGIDCSGCGYNTNKYRTERSRN